MQCGFTLKQVREMTRTYSQLLYKMLEKYDLWKVIEVTTWVSRFINNCSRIKRNGLLATSGGEQQRVYDTEKFKINQRLDLHENKESICIDKYRIQGAHPIFLPNESVLAEKAAAAVHGRTIHY